MLSPVIQYPPSTNPMLMEKEEGNDRKSKEEMARAFVHRFGMLKGQRMVGNSVSQIYYVIFNFFLCSMTKLRG